MRKLLKNKIADGTNTLVVIAIFVFAYGLDWILTCGLIKLITMCFGCLLNGVLQLEFG